MNPDWVLFGKGAMIKAGVETDPRDLFQFAEINKKKKQSVVDKENKENSVPKENEPVSRIEPSVSPEATLNISKSNTKGSIKRITIYFANNEYQDFTSE